MSSTTSPLPYELYCLIVCHISDRSALISLLQTSRTFNYEAEKILYRQISFGNASQKSWSLVTSHIASCNRIAAYVQSLDISPYGSPMEEIRDVLRATFNLKILRFRYGPGANQIPLSDVMNGVRFKLTSLDVGSYHQQDFKPFINSQNQITSIGWLPNDFIVDKPFPSDLVNIHSASTSEEFLFYLLPYCKLVRLHLWGPYTRQEPITTLEVFSTPRYLPKGAELPRLFPNLRYLEGFISDNKFVPDYVTLPPLTERVRLVIRLSSNEPDIDNHTLFEFVDKLFEKNTKIWSAEVAWIRPPTRHISGVKVRLLWGTEMRETFRLDAWDWTEWINW